jgi:hypothetical protein
MSVVPRRMTAARGFARYLSGIDPSTEVPSLGLMPNGASPQPDESWRGGGVGRWAPVGEI